MVNKSTFPSLHTFCLTQLLIEVGDRITDQIDERIDL